jgi:hypothetical protein
MKSTLLPFLLVLFSTPLIAQQLPEWYRVYTFDESIIEMNTSMVTFGGKDIGRIRFRWTFDQLESLSGEPQLKYKSRLEVIEFNCSQRRYRLYDLKFFDAAGKVVRAEEMNPPGEWQSVTSSGSMMGRLLVPACELIEQKTSPPIASNNAVELEKAASELKEVTNYALSFSQSLEQSKDFNPIVEKFFAADYLTGYLHDPDTNWFLNLNRDTAAKLAPAELQRFYVALLNTGYLSCLYFISQDPFDPDEPVPDEKVIPPDIVEVIKGHPYTATYKGSAVNFDYLAENIDSVERLRSYTDLLETIGALMRKHVVSVKAEHSKEYRAMLEDWDSTFALYQPKVRICTGDCLGLPRGTKLFDVNVPVFHLQLAEIRGELKIVSARDFFQ